jgi:hypothetical protein
LDQQLVDPATYIIFVKTEVDYCETDQSSHWSESQCNFVEETQCATTIVESYADDAVKKSAENIVKIDRESLTILFGSTTCRSGNIHNFCKD